MIEPDAGELPPLANSIRTNMQRVMAGQSVCMRHIPAAKA